MPLDYLWGCIVSCEYIMFTISRIFEKVIWCLYMANEVSEIFTSTIGVETRMPKVIKSLWIRHWLLEQKGNKFLQQIEDVISWNEFNMLFSHTNDNVVAILPNTCVVEKLCMHLVGSISIVVGIVCNQEPYLNGRKLANPLL